MSFFDKFPYTNFHELNLDWIISKLSELKESVLQAKNSETNAKSSEVNAKTSETNAKASEVNAKTSETNAKASEVNAKTSETNAKASEVNAKTSETNAKASEANAKTSETNAKASEANAESARDLAVDAEQNALNSANNAKTSETNAKTSETNAKTSETNAKTSADSAKETADKLTNWSELDAKLTQEIADRTTEDNQRILKPSKTNNLAGLAFNPIERELVSSKTISPDSLTGGIAYSSNSTGNAPVSFYEIKYLRLQLKDITAGTHQRQYLIRYLKSSFTPNDATLNDSYVAYVWGSVDGIIMTQTSTNSAEIKLGNGADNSVKINYISLVNNIKTDDYLLVNVDYTINSNYASLYKNNPIVSIRLFFEIYNPTN